MSQGNLSMSQNYQATELNTEDLIKKNLGLVKKIAWHLHGRVRGALEIEDLIQIGYTGLVVAANNFVQQEGIPFANYASIRIRGAIIDFFRKNPHHLWTQYMALILLQNNTTFAFLHCVSHFRHTQSNLRWRYKSQIPFRFFSISRDTPSRTFLFPTREVATSQYQVQVSLWVLLDLDLYDQRLIFEDVRVSLRGPQQPYGNVQDFYEKALRKKFFARRRKAVLLYSEIFEMSHT